MSDYKASNHQGLFLMNIAFNFNFVWKNNRNGLIRWSATWQHYYFQWIVVHEFLEKKMVQVFIYRILFEMHIWYLIEVAYECLNIFPFLVRHVIVYWGYALLVMGYLLFFLLIQLATLKLSMLNLKKNAWLSTFKI